MSYKRTACASAVIASIGFSSASFAALQLDEIIVTAQKREESLQDVPITITALNGEELAASGIASGEDLPLVTPGLTYYRAASSASPYIRGIGGLGTSAGNEGSVASYVDGVYMRDMSTLTQAFNNVERVEVLKGPQGTLFGRNATGGLIQTITKTPSQEAETIIDLGVGNFEVFEGSIYTTTGISENVAADLAIAVRTQGDGIGVNRTTGSDVGYEEYTSIRSKWFITPSEQTDITLTFQWGERDTDYGFNKACDERFDCMAPTSPNFADVFSDHPTGQETEAWLTALHVTHRFDNVDFTSITSYQDNESINLNDVDGSALLGTTFDLWQFSETFSQEFQLSSSYEDKLQWITGLFYWDDSAYWDPGIVTAGTFQSVMTPTIDTTSYAAYVQSYYNFTDSTQLTFGVRWTHDDRDLSGASRFFGNTVRYSDSNDFEEFTWRVALTHNFNDDIMGYLSYNRGFKSGSYNATVTTGVPEAVQNPELMDAYAIGMKGDFLDGRLRVNAEAFFNSINDLQFRAYNAQGLTRYFNAAEGEIKGLEVAATALLTDSLTMQLGYSHMDSEYVSFPTCSIDINSSTPNGGLGGNITQPFGSGTCTGNEMINTPDDTLSLVFDHSLPISSGRIDSNLTYYYNSGFWIGADNNYDQPDYSVINANIAWVSNDEQYQVGVYGNNLADEEYGTGRDINGFGNQVSVAMYPREYGLKFKYSIK